MKKKTKYLQYNRSRKFRTLDAAFAFCEGVEFVNDSCLTIIGVRTRPCQDHEVLMLDTDTTDGMDYEMRRVAETSLVKQS